MASRRNGRGRRDDRRGVDQAALAGVLWLIPIALFAFVGFKIAIATGTDPYAFVPAFDMWQMLLGFALLLGVFVFALGMRGLVNQRKRVEDSRGGRWDAYRAPNEGSK